MISLSVLSEQERNYCYSQSSEIRSMTGNLGYLRADFGSNGNSFYTTWWDFREDLKTSEFKSEFDLLINGLREEGQPFCDRREMSRYCYAHPEASDEEMRNFFFRTDSEKYAYLFRMNPNRGEYNLYCYVYVRELLDKHLQ